MIRWTVVIRSNLSEQQTQPLGSSTDSMPPAEKISPSMPVRPKSFTSTTVLSFASRRKRLMNVVLPEPSRPVTTVVLMRERPAMEMPSSVARVIYEARIKCEDPYLEKAQDA